MTAGVYFPIVDIKGRNDCDEDMYLGLKGRLKSLQRVRMHTVFILSLVFIEWEDER